MPGSSSQDSVRLRSLAKINLDLRVLHKRPDGFHELRTIFQTISLADTIEVEYQRGGRKIELKSNIEYSRQSHCKGCGSCDDAPCEPVANCEFASPSESRLGGGLGGGSSNAAAMLLALPSYWERSYRSKN